MSESARTQVLATLQQEWGTYVERFHRLAPEDQAAWVAGQGYARFADLLAHIVAWWSDARLVIDRMLHDPDLGAPAYDEDAFNAAAVARSAALDEAEVIQEFERARVAFVELVTTLPQAAFQDSQIAGRLRIEVIRHLGEHELPPPQP